MLVEISTVKWGDSDQWGDYDQAAAEFLCAPCFHSFTSDNIIPFIRLP